MDMGRRRGGETKKHRRRGSHRSTPAATLAPPYFYLRDGRPTDARHLRTLAPGSGARRRPDDPDRAPAAMSPVPPRPGPGPPPAAPLLSAQ